VHRYLRRLEAVLGAALRRLGVAPRALAGMTGVFVDDPRQQDPPRKLASIGVGLRGWVTWHGVAPTQRLTGGVRRDRPCGLASR
jgi:lipoate-protein ligase B